MDNKGFAFDPNEDDEATIKAREDKPIGFGKYKALTPKQIAVRDPQYIVWVYENVPNPPISEDLYDMCQDTPECDARDEDEERLIAVDKFMADH
jgi:hypothetical protein